jgi:hypothetical protein
VKIRYRLERAIPAAWLHGCCVAQQLFLAISGVGGLASSQATPEHSLPAMDVSSETLISRLRQHAPVWSERFGVRSLRIFGS